MEGNADMYKSNSVSEWNVTAHNLNFDISECIRVSHCGLILCQAARTIFKVIRETRHIDSSCGRSQRQGSAVH